MSLKDLGKAKEAFDIFTSVADAADDLVKFDGVGDFISDIMSGVKLDDAVKHFSKLGLEGKELKKILPDCDFEISEVESALAKAGKTGVSFTSKVKDGFKGLAASVGLSSKALLGWIGGITAVVAAFTIWKNHIEETRQHLLECVSAADEAAESWDKQQETLSGQVSRLEEIQEQLQNGNLTEEESYAIKSELYSIQQDLVTTYGEYASAIDLVNGKLDTEIQKVKELTTAEAQRKWNENYEGIQESIKQMETEKKYRLGEIQYHQFGDDARAVQKVLEKYEDVIKSSKIGDYTTVEFSFVGDPEEAQEVLNSILTDLQNEAKSYEGSKIFESFISGASNQLSNAKSLLDTYKNTYEWQKKLALLKDTEEYGSGDEYKTAAKWLSDLESAVNDYNTALTSGNTDKITEAADKFNHIKTAIESATDENGITALSLYGDQIDEIIEKLNRAAIARLDFKNELLDNKDVQAIQKSGLTDVDFKSMLHTSGIQPYEAAFRNLIKLAGEYGIEMDELVSILVELGYVTGGVAEHTEEAAKSYSDMATAVSDLKSELGALNSAASEQGYSGNITPETYDALIAKSKDYAACIEYQNGALQLNTEKANALFEAKSELQIAELELQKIADATKWKENADEIERLTKEYDGLDGAIKDQIENLKKENAGIEANLVGYDIQIAALEELTSAYGRWKAVSESDNSDSMYKDIQKAYEQIEEAQKTGQTGVGNVVYQAAVELLVPDGEDVDKYMSTLKKYIMDGSSGLTNFINDMVTNNLMDRTGSEVKMKMGVTMEQICETMKITPDMAKAIFNALEMYDFDFDWTEEDFRFNVDTSEIDAKIAELQTRIDTLKESGKTVEVGSGASLDALEKQMSELEAERARILSGITGEDTGENTVTYTIDADTENADAALDAIKVKLEEIESKIKDLAKKKLGELGGKSTLSILDSVYAALKKINAYKIADKTFTVTQYTTTTEVKPYGSISTHDQNIKNDTSAHSAVASGTRHADAGIALVGDEYSPDGSPKPELIITDGAAYVAGQSGPEFVNLNDGDQVIPADQTKKILSGNPSIRRNTIPAFATGAGGYAAGSAAEQMYLDGKISATSEWLKKQAEEKKKAEAAAKQKAAAQKKEAQTSGTSAYWTSQNTTTSSSKDTSAYWTSDAGKGVTVGGGGNTGSLTNSGGGSGGSSSSGSSSSSDSSSSSNEKSQFEKDYEYHQHLLAMEKESYEDYIKWLESAYQNAYDQGQIELEDFYKYEEEVFEGQKELFQDSINDIEHKIKALERKPGNEKQIINYYNQIISSLDKEIAAARARGLNDDDDYIQELIQQKWDYADEIADIQDEITENAKDAVEDLIDYRMDMLKQDLENEKDAVNKKLDTLKDFYEKQKEMLQDVYDEEKYLEEQTEKRKSVDDIRAEIDMLKFDDSAKAQKRIRELQEELKAAEKELTDFEKDHALENATDLLDKMYEKQESQMQSEIDAIDAKLNDPNALYNQALRDIQNNTLALYEEMVEYNNKYGSGNPEDIYAMWDEADKSLDAYFKAMGEAYKNILLVNAPKPTGYASGTANATAGIHELFEGDKDEYVFETSDGRRYKMFSGLGKKVLNASATDFLYKFANNGEAFISNMINSLVGAVGSVNKPTQQIHLSTGDVIIQGNASNETVSAIRRAQRENIDFVLRELTRLNR